MASKISGKQLIRKLFGQDYSPLLGLDISTSAVRLLALAATTKGYRVDAFAQVRLPLGAVADQTVVQIETAGQAVADALQRSGSKRREAALAVSGSQVISRQISMPAEFSDAEIEQQITLDSDQYIPYPLEDVYFDFVIMGANARNPETNDVLLIVARNEVIDKRLGALTLAGLTASVVDVEAYALESAFPLIVSQLPVAAGTGVTAMVDVGATSTTLSVLHDGLAVFTREQLFGGDQLLQQIQDSYGLTYPEAALALHDGTLPDDCRGGIIKPFLDSMASQVGRLLQVFFSATGQSAIDSVVLSGGCAGLADAAAIVGEYTGIETQVGNPFLGVEFGSNVEAAPLRAEGHAWMVAAGLAMRSMNNVSR